MYDIGIQLQLQVILCPYIFANKEESERKQNPFSLCHFNFLRPFMNEFSSESG